jgi:hypothetical protein
MTEPWRGLRRYGQATDLRGNTVRAQQSSLATEPAVWLFFDGGQVNALHLGIRGAQELREALEEFLAEHDRL